MAEPNSLTKTKKFGYGLGHILNDLCASMWFTYLLLFFHKVLEFNNLYSGVILFIGQIADGVSTVFVGFSSDRGDNYWLCRTFGRRKSWHLFGTLCVLVTFPFIFLPCVDCQDSDQYAQMIYYASFVCIFQFGWAAVQISHLAMIPELSHSSDERSGLTAIRNAASVLSNISVYIVAWLFLGIRERSEGNEQIGPEDSTAFRNIMLVVLSIGSVSSFFFHVIVPHKDEEPASFLPPPVIEPPSSPSNDSHSDVLPMPGDGLSTGTLPPLPGGRRIKMSVAEWLKCSQLYQVAVVYLATRLFVNLSQAYIPLYLQVTLQLHATSVATVPLVMFISGFVTSLILERSKRLMGRKVSFPVGCILGMSACLWIYLGCEATSCPIGNNYASEQIYGAAILFGAASSTMLVASLSLTADFIGPDVDSSAFIYGFMSLTDKVCNGVAVVLIQNYVPHFTDSCPDCRNYFKSVLVWGSGAAALLGLLALLSLLRANIGCRQNATTVTSGVVRINEDASERTPLLATNTNA